MFFHNIRQFIADVLTKALSAAQFELLRDKLQVVKSAKTCAIETNKKESQKKSDISKEENVEEITRGRIDA